MKLFKYIACGLIMAGSAVAFTSCSDDDHLEAPRLFSPVVSTSVNANSIVCTWQGIKEAKSYELTLQRALPIQNEDGTTALEDVRVVNIDVDPTGVTAYSPYTFENLDWDERYCVSIKAIGDNKESRNYVSELTTLTYPTKLRTVSKIIDTAMMMEWNDGADADIAYVNVFVRNEDGTVTPWKRANSAEDAEQPEYYYTLNATDLANSSIVIDQLQPETDFRVVAYSANGEYRGRRDFTTQASEVFDNPELVVDLRQESTDTLKAEFFENLPNGAIVLLTGGKSYVASGTFTHDLTIRTGMSLSGKATLMSGGMAAKGDINNIRIENVKYTCLPGDDKSSNFGGRYFFNNGDDYNIGNLTFEDVEVVAMRGFIRTRKSGQHFGNIVFNNCVMDSIGGYKLIHLDTADTSIDNVTITNSTFSTIDGIIRANNRDNTNIKNVTVENCTFAYASNGAELFMFKRDGCSEDLSFSMTNCIIGGNYPGKQGMGASFNAGVVAAFDKIYVSSDFVWATDANTGDIKNPLGAYSTLKESIDQLWVDPAKRDFTLKSGSFECSEAGDPRWRVAK